MSSVHVAKSVKWDGLHLKMTRCAVELLVVGEESKQNYTFFFVQGCENYDLFSL